MLQLARETLLFWAGNAAGFGYDSYQYTLVQGARPVGTGVRCVQHFLFLGLLPPAIDGWSDITELYVACYGVPKAGKAIWIRTCQHIDGWIDVPKVLRARVGPQRSNVQQRIRARGTG